MKKKKFIPHDIWALDDPKILKLRRKWGLLGYGIFWVILERLYAEDGFLDYSEEFIESMAYDLHADAEIFFSVIRDFDLFQINEEKWKFFSRSALERIEIRNEKSKKMSEAGKKWMQNRWQNDTKNNDENFTKNGKNNNSITNVTKNITNVIENDNNCYENYNYSITTKLNKTKLNKNTLNPLTSSEVCEESPISEKTSDKESVKSVFIFKKFFEKFPKKTHEKEAEIAFLNLDEVEIREISRVFPFWLNYWANIDPFYVPNAYNWLFNKSWRNKIPEKNGNFVSEKPAKIQPIPDNFPKDFDEKNRQKEAEEREKFLKIFSEFSPEKQAEITEKVKQKFAWTPVKNGDLLWQIEIARIMKAEFEGF